MPAYLYPKTDGCVDPMPSLTRHALCAVYLRRLSYLHSCAITVILRARSWQVSTVILFVSFFLHKPTLHESWHNMHELISHPGLQFCVFQLSGKLAYTLTPAERPPRSFELHESDFEDAKAAVKDVEPVRMAGTEASAVGLELTFIRNFGHLEMKPEGKDGSIGQWTFDGLRETSRHAKMCASAAAQACIATFIIKPSQASHEPLIDTHSPIVSREKNLETTSSGCSTKGGTLRKKTSKGKAKSLWGIVTYQEVYLKMNTKPERRR
jgi:hypothetical protein